MTVEHILQVKGRDVVTIDKETTLADAARMLAERRIGALIVSAAERPVLGIVSERDIVRAVAERGAAALADRVAELMTQKVVTCTSKAALNDIMELMTEGKFRHIPVLEDGRLGGIVSIGDIVKHRLAEIEAETRAMRDYIATA
jgi:CBS domain-containing protein